MNRCVGHSQVLTANNYNTLRITVTITHKIKTSTSLLGNKSIWLTLQLLICLTKHFLTTLNNVCLSSLFLWQIHESTNPLSFIIVTRPSQKSPCLSVPLFLYVSSVVTKRITISGQSSDFSKRVRCRETCFNNPLSSNWLFPHNI
jgi:hypothetical protein